MGEDKTHAMVDIHSCAIGNGSATRGATRWSCLPQHQYFDAWQTTLTALSTTSFIRLQKQEQRYQDLQELTTTTLQNSPLFQLLFNMLFIAILLFALLGINQANAGVRLSNTLFSNTSN
jgi:hypothetical protein